MYVVPIFMLILGLLLLIVSIYLFLSDYKYVVVERKISHSYLIPNIICILLAVSILIYIPSYFFTV
ncbi:hypothetical protein A5816_002962 [Enterococcus sp. 3G1_DIV0629]|nr:hypothetical protein A5816_002962 [Enterococcus sp. 3G1_DIV0629]